MNAWMCLFHLQLLCERLDWEGNHHLISHQEMVNIPIFTPFHSTWSNLSTKLVILHKKSFICTELGLWKFYEVKFKLLGVLYFKQRILRGSFWVLAWRERAFRLISCDNQYSSHLTGTSTTHVTKPFVFDGNWWPWNLSTNHSTELFYHKGLAVIINSDSLL